MAKFASAEKQAQSVVKALVSQKSIKSLGTARNYVQSLTRVGEFVKEQKIPSLRSLTVEQANIYLAARGEKVGQKTLDMDRQAIQAMFVNLTGQLPPGETLTAKSEIDQILKGRAYKAEQAALVASHQRGGNRLATEIAHAAGLRAHELLTLRPAGERPADARAALDSKWLGREGVNYTVQGKGGLIREVLIPHDLAQKLENLRYNSPVRATDRGIHYQQHYAIAGGKKWSDSFSRASQRALGWSSGAHGLRHSYAQQRMAELLQRGLTRQASLETVSQEMGHFRPDITEVYLR